MKCKSFLGGRRGAMPCSDTICPPYPHQQPMSSRPDEQSEGVKRSPFDGQESERGDPSLRRLHSTPVLHKNNKKANFKSKKSFTVDAVVLRVKF
jgi:hypothetical protein